MSGVRGQSDVPDIHLRSLRTPFVVLGAGGMVGGAWAAELARRSIPHRALTRGVCDLTDRASVERVFAEDVGTLVNCAAWTDVDGAEKNEAGAFAVNEAGPGLLAERCREAGATLVHYSTDYVFGGSAADAQTYPRGYPEDAPTGPLNAYGRSKLAGERAVLASGCDALIVRTSWVYHHTGRNFVRTIAALAREREDLRVVADQHGRPTEASTLARVSMGLLAGGARGVVHAAGGGRCTWHELAQRVVDCLGLRTRVVPCASAEYPRPARRPAFSVLDTDRATRIVGDLPDWREEVARVVSSLGERATSA